MPDTWDAFPVEQPAPAPAAAAGFDQYPIVAQASPAPAAQPPRSWGDTAADAGRFAMTAAARGLGGLADALTDPLAPVRRLVSPDLERIEQSARPHPGQAAGDAMFSAAGVPEYKPETALGRVGLSAATGAVAGGPFGVGGALLGGAGAALGQGTQEATGNERLATAASLLPGAAVGGAASLGNATRNAMAPRVQSLVDAGVRPTIGQTLGGTVGRAEEAATSVPVLGDFIKSGRARAVEDFNRGAINMALKPIGEELDKNTPLGRDAIVEAGDKIDAAYDRLVPGLSVKADPEFAQDLTGLVGMSRFMPPDRQKQFANVLNDQVLSKLSPGGGMTGESFKEVESTLDRLASQYRNSTSADERQLGGALQELQSSMRDLLVRANPDKAKELGAVNSAYANLLRVQGAAGRIGSEEGVFSPAQLLSSVRQLDRSLRKSQFARGGARMQDYAEAGKSVLGNKVPDSGTPLRSMTTLLGGALLGNAISPATGFGIAGGALGLGGMYSPAGQGLLAAFLARKAAGTPLGIAGLLAPQTAQNPGDRVNY